MSEIHWTHGPIPCSSCAACDKSGDDLLTACSNPLRVLSLWQPWATLVVATDPYKAPRFAGPKEWETRSWKPWLSLPFQVVIHAAKQYSLLNRTHFTRSPFSTALERCGFYPGDPRSTSKKSQPPAHQRRVPLGALIGTATVRAVVTTEEWLKSRQAEDPSAATWSTERVFGNYDRGRFAWQLTDAFEFVEPIPFVGKQEPLYAVDRETFAKVSAAKLRIAA